jgi:hypothetical protein
LTDRQRSTATTTGVVIRGVIQYGRKWVGHLLSTIIMDKDNSLTLKPKKKEPYGSFF